MEGAPDVAPARSIGAYYLCLFVAIGGYGPFMAVELASRGVATDRLAEALSLLPIVRVLAGPAWSAFADRVRSATWALRVATFGAAAAFLGVVYAPSAGALVAATLVFAAIRAPVGGLIDAVNLQRVSARGGSFGGLRLWGTVGYTLAVLCTGALLGSGRGDLVRWLSLAGIVGAALATLAMPVVLGRAPVSLRAGLAALLQRPRFAVILAAGMLHQVGMAAYDGLFGLHLTRLGHGAAASYAIALGTVGEVVVMAYAKRVIDRLGVRRALTLCFVVGAVRWAVIASTQRVWVLVLVQVTHALAFGLYFVASVAGIDREAPAEVRASAQGIQAAAVWGVGSALALRLAGALGGAEAIPKVFAAGALGSIAAAALVAVGLRENRPAPDGGV